MRLLGVEIVGAIERRPERRRWNVTGVSIDSRSVRPGELFFALEGTRTDGHCYVAQALAKGADAAVVHREVDVPEEHKDRLVRVENTLRALGESASEYRRRWNGKVIAITGSNGKTTTREMLYHILSDKIPCKQSPKSFNTNIGVPLTLCQAEEQDEALILEMGTNAPGEISELAAMARPDAGLITNIGNSHLEGLGSVAGVADAKAELLDALDGEGTALLNADDAWFGFLSERHQGQLVSFGLGPRGDFRASAVRSVNGGHWFIIPGGIEVTLNVPGIHNVRNAVGALATAKWLGVDLPAAAARLADFRLPPMRWQTEQIRDVTVIMDCYNANPDSMRAALETFSHLPATGRRIAVLGDMKELGQASEALHAKLGKDLGKFNVDFAWAVGQYGECVARAAAVGGLGSSVVCAATLEEAAEKVSACLKPGDALLVKGSRIMAMEKLVEELRRGVPLRA